MILLRRFGLDLLLVLFAAAVAASVLTSDVRPRVTVAVISAASVLVFCARSWSPLAVVLASFAFTAVGMDLEPRSTTLQFMAMLFSFALAGALTRGRDLALAAMCGLGLLGYGTFGLSTSDGFSDFVLSSAISMGFLAGGWQVSARGHQLTEARQVAAAAAAAQHALTRQAIADERARIARELHDVVSHGLSVVVVQVQAARGSIEDLPGDTTAATRRLDAVEAMAREALGEMRRMLDLLQIDELDDPDGQVGPEPPTPGLACLPALVNRARSAGLTVAADVPDTAPPQGAGLELAAYRIVQESLTNVLRHAPGAEVSVHLAVGPTALEIRVRNTAPTTGFSDSLTGGLGLIGMRERARTYGGRCDAGRIEGGLFEVHAVLPLEHLEVESLRW